MICESSDFDVASAFSSPLLLISLPPFALRLSSFGGGSLVPLVSAGFVGCSALYSLPNIRDCVAYSAFVILSRMPPSNRCMMLIMERQVIDFDVSIK